MKRLASPVRGRMQNNKGYMATKGSVKGLNIFALTIPEIINILDREVNDQKIFDNLDDFSDIELHRIENGWREKIVSEILA